MNTARDRWPERGGFLAAGIGTALGIDAMIALPDAALAHGGGAFLIAWLVALATAAVPVLSLEYALGVYFQVSLPDAMRRVDKRLEWLGWWSIVLAVLAMLALAAGLAWGALLGTDALLGLVGGGRPVLRSAASMVGVTPVSGAALVAALAALWLGVRAVVGGGVARAGRWASSAVACAGIGLAISGGAVLTIPGALDGVAALLTPEWTALAEPTTWSAAYTLAFRTLGVGLGIHVMLASHLNRGADATGTAAVTVLAAACFALPAALVAAAARGGLAVAQAIPLAADAQGVAGALVTVPAAIALVDAPAWARALFQLAWAVAWVGAGATAFAALVAAVAGALVDKFQIDVRTVLDRLCAAGFFASIPFVSLPGIALIDSARLFGFAVGVVPVLFGQCLALAWAAGGLGLQRHINAYSVIPARRGWRMMVGIVAPAALAGILIEAVISIVRAPWPESVQSIGVFTAVITAVPLAWSLAFMQTRRAQ